MWLRWAGGRLFRFSPCTTPPSGQLTAFLSRWPTSWRRIIEPGAIKTDFYGRSNEFVHNRELADYNDLVDRGFKTMNAAGEKGAPPERVADAIVRAATDDGEKLRYVVGVDAKGLLAIRRVLPFGVYRRLIRKAIFG